MKNSKKRSGALPSRAAPAKKSISADASSEMTAVYEARRRNLNELIERNNDASGRGGLTVIANRLGLGWTGFIRQSRSRPDQYGHRVITEATARRIEAVFSLPVGAMDVYPLPPEGTPVDRKPSDNKLIGLLADAADRARVHLDTDKLDAAVRAMRAAGRTDPEYADIVVSLMR